jgi:hypothetical protein
MTSATTGPSRGTGGPDDTRGPRTVPAHSAAARPAPTADHLAAGVATATTDWGQVMSQVDDFLAATTRDWPKLKPLSITVIQARAWPCGRATTR